LQWNDRWNLNGICSPLQLEKAFIDRKINEVEFVCWNPVFARLLLSS
jgi:hypothetical protein